MANEILTSTLSNAQVTEALSRDMQLALADRFSLFGHPAIVYVGNCAGRGSNVIKVPIVSLLGVDRMAPTAEGSSSSNTTITNTSATVTVARQTLQRKPSDLAMMVDSVGVLDSRAIVSDMVSAAYMRFTEMIVNLADGFSSTVSDTGVNMDVSDFFTAQFTLTQASVPGPYLWVPYPTQYTDFVGNLRTQTGVMEHRADAGMALDIQGPGVAATYNGVDIALSSLVPTANSGADSASGMWGRGAIGYGDGTPAPIMGAGAVTYPAGSSIFIEYSRDPDSGESKITGNFYVGASILEDGRGVSIITDR